MELYVLGKVDKYGGVFDPHEFYEHFNEYKESIYERAERDEFALEIVEEFEKLSSSREDTSSQTSSWCKKIWKNLFKKP